MDWEGFFVVRSLQDFIMLLTVIVHFSSYFIRHRYGSCIRVHMESAGLQQASWKVWYLVQSLGLTADRSPVTHKMSQADVVLCGLLYGAQLQRLPVAGNRASTA